MLNIPNSHNFSDFAQTPAFYIDKNWGSHIQEWNVLEQDQSRAIKEMDSSSISKSNGRKSSINSTEKDNRKYTQILS